MEDLTTITFRSKIFDYEKGEDWKYLGDKPAIIDCFTYWCSPCKLLIPILEELEKEYGDRINFYKINTESESELSALFKVRSIPTMLFIPMNGEPRISNGLIPKTSIEKVMKDVFGI